MIFWNTQIIEMLFQNILIVKIKKLYEGLENNIVVRSKFEGHLKSTSPH